MKLNSTVTLTLILLILMAAAGLLSASWGTALGREALKGITQPDTRPTNNLANRQSGAARREDLPVLSEDDIIANVKVRMGVKEAKTNTAPPAKTAGAIDSSTKAQFPLTARSKDVVLAVTSVQKDGDALVLQVTLRNNSRQPVRFLYDFLTVTSEGRALKAAAEGLPAELPASSDEFSGTVRIPADSLSGVKKLSLSLTDYPDKQLDLRLPNIPVAQ